MLVTTTAVALFKTEVEPTNPTKDPTSPPTSLVVSPTKDPNEEDGELDASEIGLKETYHRLWAVCQLPAVRQLFLILLTYRLPTALSDNVKLLKAVVSLFVLLVFALKCVTHLMVPFLITGNGFIQDGYSTLVSGRYPSSWNPCADCGNSHLAWTSSSSVHDGLSLSCHANPTIRYHHAACLATWESANVYRYWALLVDHHNVDSWSGNRKLTPVQW
jgi:hypothetical protein